MQENTQKSLGWHRRRLGKFNASEVAALMTSPRAKSESWSQTALTYISKVAAQRSLAPSFVMDDEAFAELNELNNGGSKITAWGVNHEDEAREWYATENLVTITEGGSVKCASVPSLAASPDGYVEDDGLIEIKSPATYESAFKMMRCKTPADIKALKPEYYWQMIAQMLVTGRKWCDFVVWAPFMKQNAVVIRVDRDEAEIAALSQKVNAADELITSWGVEWSNDQFEA